MQDHSFNMEVAKLVGVNAAVIFQNIQFWCEKNKANKKNMKDGEVWTYNSVRAWSELFPYLSPRSIRTAIDKLVDAGLIKKANYNRAGYDKTTWYAICQNWQMHLSEMTNRLVSIDKPIPDSKPDSKPIEDNARSDDQALSDQEITKLVEDAFEWFWYNGWKEAKKIIGKNDSTPKSDTFKSKWKPMFNRSYFKNNSKQKFQEEINQMAEFCIKAHMVEDGNNSHRNMHLATFLKYRQWRD